MILRVHISHLFSWSVLHVFSLLALSFLCANLPQTHCLFAAVILTKWTGLSCEGLVTISDIIMSFLNVKTADWLSLFYCVKKTMKFTILIILSVNSSMVLSIFTLLCNRSPELFQLASLKLYTHFPFPPPQPLFYFLFLWIWLLWVEFTQHLSFYDCLISLSMMSSKFIHVVACGRMSFFFKAW